MAYFSISSSDNIIDSRALEKEYDDYVSSIEDVESDIEDTLEQIAALEDELLGVEADDVSETDRITGEISDLQERHTGLVQDLKDLVEDDDWKELKEFYEDIPESVIRNQECLISDSHFEDYCRQLVEDIGDLPRDLPSYIENNIDWSGVADDIKMEYSSSEYEGTTYYYRYC